ncbi:hypothetical protein GJAV_G00150930 [Gymnothorax javanicus]|nr:hypothetical protein GJAV_G00150930 [Gymnothorax javanicus]
MAKASRHSGLVYTLRNNRTQTLAKMPNTRSQRQPTLPFPKRRSASSRTKGTAGPKQGSPCPPDLQNACKTHLPTQSPGSAPRSLVSPRTAVQPLSPRKRTGDENGCNLPPNLLGSPPKQKCPELSSGRRLNFDENAPYLSPVPKKTAATRPVLQLDSPNKPSIQPQEASENSSACSEKSPTAQLCYGKDSCYKSVKQALHTALPERLLSRDRERAFIRSFLTDRVKQGAPASLYISGAPGTGKTACLNCVLQEMEDQLQSVQKVLINCMRLRSSQSIFPLLAERLGGSRGQDARCLEKLLTTAGPTVLLVLDEMDQLDCKAQDVLYTIFEWPYLPKSRLCLIGIANALDLTDRVLPRLQSRPHCRPDLLHFPPYTKQELMAIMQDRLAQVSGEVVLDAAAVQFCARKVSAVSGDARKALDICRRAVEIVESDARRSKVNPGPDTKGSHVSVPQVAKGKGREISLGKLHEVYSRLCVQRQVAGVGQGECLSLCTLLESRGIFSMKKAKEARLTKVSLKIEERDIENALKDRTLLGSILSTGLP